MATPRNILGEAEALLAEGRAREVLSLLAEVDPRSDRDGNVLRLTVEADLQLGNSAEALRSLQRLVRHRGSYLNRAFCRRVQQERFLPSELLMTIRLAVIGNTTLEPLGDEIALEAMAEGLGAEIWVGGYDQFRTEILGDGPLYAQPRDVTICLLDYRPLIGALYDYSLASDDGEVCQEIESLISELVQLSSRVAEKTGGYMLLTNAVMPAANVTGFLGGRGRMGQRGGFALLNRRLDEEMSKRPGCFVLDAELALSAVGKDNSYDVAQDYLAHQPYSQAGRIALARQAAVFCRQTLAKARKCLVLDLDNTLWGGIIGEDGLEGIRLGPDQVGRAFVDFQKEVLRWHRQGVILAVCSRNNPADAEEVFAQHPHMVLRTEHFAEMAVNWNDKPTNLRHIAKEINIGLDSLVFLDDNPAERAAVREMVPEVLVPELPSDPAARPAFVTALDVFQSIQATQDDLERGRSYAQERQRKVFRSQAVSLEQYYRNLQMVVRVEEVSEAVIPRVAQLLGRTNQFNLTTRRHSEAQIRAHLADGSWRIYTLRLTDRFGDSGLVGAAILEPCGQVWRVDSFLMSCRVLGRNVEVALLAYAARQAATAGAAELIGEYIPTKKNSQAADFYPRNGMQPIDPQGQTQRWRCSLPDGAPRWPDYIRLETAGAETS